jgi:tape measure domain-containing protein
VAQNRIGILIETKESGSKAASDSVRKNLKQVEGDTGSASQAAERFKSNFDFIGTAAKAATAVVAGSATAFLGFGLASATQLQNTAASFRALTGDAQVAKDLFTDLYDFARGTPFAFPDVTGAARTLLGYGRTAQQVKGDIQTLGGLVATTGANWSNLAVVYGQVNAAGKLYAQDALQLIENGVPITTALAKKLGVSISDVRDKMAAGEISAQTFNEAMRGMVPADAIEKMSNTMTGRLSGLTGSVRALAFSMIGIDYSKFDDGSPVLVEQGGLFDRLTKAVQGFSDAMSTPELKNAAKQIGNGLANFVEGAGQQLVNWVKWGSTHLPEIKFALIGVASAFIAFKIANVVTDLVAFAKAAQTVGLALSALSLNPIVLGVAAAAALAVGLVYLQTKFDIVGKAAGFLKDAWGHVQDAWDNSVEFVKGKFSDAMKAGGDAVDWMRDRIKDGIDFYESYDGWIKGIAITLGVIFGPALIRAGVLAVVQGVKIAASGIAAGAGWVAGAVSASAAWVANLAKTVAAGAVNSVKMVAHAVVAGTAWALNAGKASLAWALESAKILLTSSATSIKMAAHAADAGWAWILNAGRASFAWVTTQLPKIVAATLLTSGKSVAHAAAASAAWVASAATSSFAWVTTELPKIVAGFVTTAASATAQAAIASAAWIANAVKVSVAWVVTELPKVVAAFVVTTAAAVTQAGLSAGAWATAAATTSATWGALSALLATPLVMPAIAIGAALVSIAAVMTAYNNMKAAIQGAKDAAAANSKATQDILNRNAQVQASGVYSADYKAQYNKVAQNALKADAQLMNLPIPKFATGGYTGPGPVNEIAGVVHKGEFVVPKKDVDQSTGLPKQQQTNDRSGLTINGGLHIHNNLDEQKFLGLIGRKLATR